VILCRGLPANVLARRLDPRPIIPCSNPLILQAQPLSSVSRAGHSGLRRSLPTAVVPEEAAEEDALAQACAVGSARRGLVKTGRPSRFSTSRYLSISQALLTHAVISIHLLSLSELQSEFCLLLQVTPSLILFIQSNCTVLRCGSYGG
jgi:hypothetical protein